MSSVVVMTKQGVRNLNELGPQKKPEGAERAPDAEGVPATEVHQKPPADESTIDG